MKGALKTLVVLSLLMAASSHAGIFVCKDSSGRTLTADRPIAECADRPMRELGSNGNLKRNIPAPLTAEQKRQRELDLLRVKADLDAADELKRSDRALTARYRREEDIAHARRRDTEVVTDQIAQQKKALSNAKADWKAAEIAVEQKKQSGVVPPPLQYRHDQARRNVQQMTERLRDSENELAQINAKYDGTLLRFREISKAASSQ